MQPFYQPQQQPGGVPLPPPQLGVPQPPQTSTASSSGSLPFQLPPTPASSIDSDKKSVQMKLLSPTSSTPQPLPPSSSQAPTTEPKVELLSEIKAESFSPSTAVSAHNPSSRPEGNTGMDTLPSEPLPSVPNVPTPSQVPSGMRVLWNIIPLCMCVHSSIWFVKPVCDQNVLTITCSYAMFLPLLRPQFPV